MRAMFKEIGILVKEDLTDRVDNEALNLMINSLLNLDINLYIDKSSNNKNENFTVLEHKEFVKKSRYCCSFWWRWHSFECRKEVLKFRYSYSWN